MIKTTTLFLFIILFHVFSATSQTITRQQQAINYLEQGKKAFMKYGVEDSLRVYALKSEKIAREIDDKYLIVKSLTYLGYSYIKDSTIKNTEFYWIEALKTATTLKMDSASANINNKFGSLYIDRNQPKKAIPYFIKSIKLYSKIGEIGMQAEPYLGLTNIYSQLHDVENRAINLSKARVVGEKIKDDGNKIIVLSQVASHYVDMGQIDVKYADTAKYLCESLIPITKSLKFNSRVGSIYLTLFSVYSFGNLESGNEIKKQAYIDSVILYQKYLSPQQKELFFIRAATHERRVGNYKQALSYIKSAKSFNNHKNINRLLSIHTQKYQIHSALNEHELAYNSLYITFKLKDSIRSTERFNTVRDLEEKYESELKASEIVELEQENEIKSLKIRQRNWLVFWLALIALVIFILIWLFNRQQKLKKNQKILETKHKLLRSQMNPHFLFNGFTALQRSIMKDDNKINTVTHLSEFSRLMRSVLESSFNELVPLNDELDLLENYLKLQRFRFDNSFTFQLNVSPEINKATTLIPPMLLQPFLENSIEHGRDENSSSLNILLNFKIENDYLTIIVTDNGVGFSKKEEKENDHISRALFIVEERLLLLEPLLHKKSNVEIINISDVDNAKTGVKVVLQIPHKII